MGKELIEEFRRRVGNDAGVAEMTALYADLLSLQSSVEQDFIVPPVSQQDVQARISRRVPALAPEELRAEANAFQDIWKRVYAVTLQHRADLQDALDEICRWAEADEGHLEQLAELYLRGELQIISQEAGLDPALLKFLMNQALRPFLRRYAQTVAPWIHTDNWYQPYCPVCGGEPDFAVLEKPHGTRRLLCSRCDFEWPYRRTSCPYCGCADPEKYQYALSEDNVYRLYLCDHCHRYLKTLDLREIFEDRLLPVERIVTLPMDIAAYQAGYCGM